MKKINFYIKGIIIIFLLNITSQNIFAQLIINTTLTADELVQNILIGAGVTVSGVSYTGHANSIAAFSNGATTNLGLSEGIVLTSGNVNDIPNPVTPPPASIDMGTPGDPDLEALVSNTSYDASVLVFDFIPLSDTLKFNYVFGSEEYHEFVCSPYNDVFAFFVSGGPEGYVNENIALIPGSSLPVAINSVNNGSIGSDPSCDAANCVSLAYDAYFVNNEALGGTTIVYDGFTTVLNAWCLVTACEQYHIKIAISDMGDGALDSGVFLEAYSFSTNAVSLDVSYTIPSYEAIEGCSDGIITLTISGPLANDLVINYTIGGTADNGTDYTAIPGSVTIPAGMTSATIVIHPVTDIITEGTETVTLDIETSICGTEQIIVNIIDNIPVVATASNDETICDDETTTISVTATNGISPYTYSWSDGLGSGTSAFIIPPGIGITTYTVTITDACGSTATDSVTITAVNCGCQTPPTNFSIINSPCYDSQAIFQYTGTASDTANYNWNFDGGTVVSGSGQGPVYVIFPTGGTYNITLIVNYNFCNSSDTTISVIVPPEIVIDSENFSNVECYGYNNGSIIIAASGGTPPLSYSTGGAPQASGTFTGLSAGTYIVTVTDDNGCTQTSSIITIIEPSEITVTTSQSPGTTICVGQPVQIVATAIGGTGPYIYYWDSIQAGPIINVTPNTTTNYTVWASDANSCKSTVAYGTVNVYPPLSITLSANHDTICSGDSVVISAIVGGGDGAPYLITNLTDDIVVSPPFTVFPQVNTNYEISVNDFCTTPVATGTILITVLPSPPIVMYANPVEGCQPLTVQFLESSPDELQNYLWDFGDDAFNISYKKNPEHTFLNEGTYDISIRVTSIFGCINTELREEMITVYPKPDASFTTYPQFVSIIKPIIYFDNLSTICEVSHWSFGDGDSAHVMNPGHTNHYYDESGNYTVTLIAQSDKNCLDTAYQDVFVKDEFTFYAPTGFSPDNNGTNDIFLPVGTGIDTDNYLLIIYDRWGEKAFVTHDLYQGWDGRIKGKNIGENGTYTWLVIYKDIQGVEHQETGMVSLIR